MGLSYRLNATEVPDDVRLVQLDTSILGLPKPLLSVGFCVFHCLDEVPLSFLLVVLR